MGSVKESYTSKSMEKEFWSLLGRNVAALRSMFIHISCIYASITRVGWVTAVRSVVTVMRAWKRVCIYPSNPLTSLSYGYISIKGWRSSCEGAFCCQVVVSSIQVQITLPTRSTRKSKLTLRSRQHVQSDWPEKAHSLTPPNAVKQTSTCMFLWAPWQVIWFTIRNPKVKKHLL